MIGFLNRHLDAMASPTVTVLGKRRSAFHMGGVIGLTLATILTTALVSFRGLSLWVLAGIILTAVGTFFALAMLTKIISGEESLTYYHHEIAVLLMVSGYLWLLRRPILPYLEITLLGVGIFLFSGRIGCLMVGCCHGRPSKWGVCYRREHALAGFSHYLVGARLFPIQLVESLTVLIIVLVGVVIVLRDGLPGAALAWYVIVYDLARFSFEFLRGDRDRPYWRGFSEAQWTSLLLMLVVIALETAGLLPFHAWHLAAVLGLLLIMTAITTRRRLAHNDLDQLFHPRHIHEVAQALAPAVHEEHLQPGSPGDIDITSTPLGLQISASKGSQPDGDYYLYALSRRDGSLTEKTAANWRRRSCC
jgi:prolipoprotein diacylglyceryltransferase